MSNGKFAFRHTLFSILFATLLVTAGCSGILSDSDDRSGATPTSVLGGSDDEPVPDNETDLRRVAIPDNGSTTVSGELDTDDPISDNKFYEPVQIEVKAGAQANITMQADGGEPMLRVVNPIGNVTQTVRNSDSGTVELIGGTFSKTGNYTIEVTSDNPNETFEYNLTIERAGSGIFAGAKSTWNETEKYLAFGRTFARAANATADNGQFSGYVSRRSLWANAQEDYLIIGYQWDAENLTTREMVDIDTAIELTYANLDETYRNATGNPEFAENKSWVPEIIYFRAENPNGELYRTNFLTLDWAREYAETEDIRSYSDRYYSTNRIGPGSPSYEEGGDVMTTDEAFPLGTYLNYTFPDGTTLEERYYD
ncbi:hypothetical protein NDI56_14765 [Haloarcula sp. S1CR25-12]|uniref:Uncharacterized protein n=1 Tax=Haloarcula saliterrae TaxID=2950534 RepID=A0ABU2FEH2_9EURY|nr:hypothetical protein [Haloarcula sp. S1CR25-12]MDS0260666.1 hypothetical protein [Haloarcula sp. S1CR25-12]